MAFPFSWGIIYTAALLKIIFAENVSISSKNNKGKTLIISYSHIGININT